MMRAEGGSVCRHRGTGNHLGDGELSVWLQAGGPGLASETWVPLCSQTQVSKTRPGPPAYRSLRWFVVGQWLGWWPDNRPFFLFSKADHSSVTDLLWKVLLREGVLPGRLSGRCDAIHVHRRGTTSSRCLLCPYRRIVPFRRGAASCRRVS
jgi:hypothetical protein